MFGEPLRPGIGALSGLRGSPPWVIHNGSAAELALWRRSSAVHDLPALLPDGVAPRHELARTSSPSSVSRWTATGALVHLHPGVVVLAERRDDPVVRARAATLWAGGPLSHLSALWFWDAVPVAVDPVHVLVPADRCPRGTRGVRVHRTAQPLPITTLRGVPVVHLARSLVDAWALAAGPRAAAGEIPLVRQAVIESVRDRGVSLAALRAESASAGRHTGKAGLRRLLDLLRDGCESELEIWGVTQVLPGPPAAPKWVQQHRVRLASGRWVELDAAYPEARVAIELDGAAFHGSRSAREKDLRRDSALATLGWVVLRFSYARLVSDPEGCRREIEAVVRLRLAQR